MGTNFQVSKGWLAIPALLLLILGGCASSLIDVQPGSDQVALVEPSQVGHCTPIGKTTVSVLAQVGFVSRGIDNVDADLLQLARNEAVNQGGDTVVPGDRPEIGKRTFSIYKCRP